MSNSCLVQVQHKCRRSHGMASTCHHCWGSCVEDTVTHKCCLGGSSCMLSTDVVPSHNSPGSHTVHHSHGKHVLMNLLQLPSSYLTQHHCHWGLKWQCQFRFLDQSTHWKHLNSHEKHCMEQQREKGHCEFLERQSCLIEVVGMAEMQNQSKLQNH